MPSEFRVIVQVDGYSRLMTNSLQKKKIPQITSLPTFYILPVKSPPFFFCPLLKMLFSFSAYLSSRLWFFLIFLPILDSLNNGN